VLGPLFDPGSAQIADDDLRRFTFTEEALAAATGVVVHSRWHGAIVRSLWSGPVCDAWPPAQRPTASSIPTRTQGDDLDEDRITLMTLGPVEPRTGVGEVIDALAANPCLATRTRYVVAGRAGSNDGHVRGLTARIAEAGLADNVQMLGYLRPVEVDQWARAADAFIDLRYPDDEGFALSLMYELPFGKPVVARDVGPNAEIPNQAVVKIAEGDPAGLGRRLRELVGSTARRQAIGEAGKRFADDHEARGYAERLLRFAKEDASAVGAEPLAEAAGRAVADRIAEQIGAMLSSVGAGPDWPGVDPVIREASRLLWPMSD
jgi:glycosyltransferase involved in cell wall biosynthesis